MFDSVAISDRCSRALSGRSPHQLLDQRQSRRPVALLEEGVEQQLFGLLVAGPGNDDAAQPDDRLVVLAGAQQQADRVMLPRRGGSRRGIEVRHCYSVQRPARIRAKSLYGRNLHNLAVAAKVNGWPLRQKINGAGAPQVMISAFPADNPGVISRASVNKPPKPDIETA
jgi:hypothetical protein